jgi:dihydropteroate synthase
MTVYPVFGNSNDLLDELRKIGCDEKAVSIFNKKFDTLPVKIIGMKCALANIIKQEMLSAKGDAVVHSKTVSCEIDKTDILLLGSPSVYANLIRKLEYQDYPTLLELGRQIRKMLDNFYNHIDSQKTRGGKTLSYGSPVIMGILNVTEDSFHDGGKFMDTDTAVRRAEEMVMQGASVIDIGGESSRPGAAPVPAEQEAERVLPVVEKIKKNMDAIVSVDTYKSAVAEETLKAGADMINDISAFTFDPKMAGVVKKYGALAVLMHMKGNPGNMQDHPHYDDVVREVVEFFDERVRYAVSEGIPEERIIIDPGIGFGKDLDHNKSLINHLSSLKKYGLPVMIGVSRKSMVGMILSGGKDASAVPTSERLYGTLGAHALAYMNGADIFRVHDVREHAQLFQVLKAIK